MNCPRFLLPCLVGILLPVASLRADPTTYTWTGAHGSYAADGRNWAGGVLPATDGSAFLVFGNAPSTFVYFDQIVHAMGVEVSGNTRPYFFSGLAFSIGPFGITYTPNIQDPDKARTQIQAVVNLTSNQTWAINSGTLELWSPIITPEGGGPHTLTKTGAGTLDLRHSGTGNSPWNGSLTIRDGFVVVHAALDDSDISAPTNVLGSGTVTIDSTQGGLPGLVASDHLGNNGQGGYFENLAVLIPNAFSLKGRISLHAETELRLLGNITLAGHTTLAPSGDAVYFQGAIGDGGQGYRLTVDNHGLVILDPRTNEEVQGGAEIPLNTYSGGTHVQSGGLVFANADALPAQGMLTSSATGYIGFGDSVGASTFLSRFDPANTAGTIGFDSDPEGETLTTVSTAINLTGFHPSARLGSVTQAALSGTITPAGNNYQFGGGGGRLIVHSLLTDDGQTPRGIQALSPNFAPLSVWFTNSGNSFTGGAHASHSGLVFDAGALPATGNLALGPGGYIGTTVSFGTDQQYADHLARFTGNQGVIGFDRPINSLNPRTLSNPLTLPAGYYLGTSSRFGNDGIDGPGLILTGPLTGAIESGNEVLRFAAYKGGILEVASDLTNPNAKVFIGDPNSVGTFGDPNQEEFSVVALTGDNAYGGTTTLYTGHLALGQSNGTPGTNPTTALGTGALIVQPHNIVLPGEDGLYPLLSALHNGLIVPNAVDLHADLALGGDNDLRFTGPISGAGRLYIGEESEYGLHVRLDGANSGFFGGIYIERDSSVTFGGDTSAGTGRLEFGGSPDGTAFFLSSNPVIGGLASDQGGTVYLQPGATLGIGQSDHTTFRGSIMVNNQVALSGGGFEPPSLTTVEFNGPGSLRFTNDQYIDAFRITGGTVVASSDSSEGGSLTLGDTVHLQGGALVLQNATLFSELDLQSGTLAGNGFFNTENSPVIGAGVVLSPGTPGEGGIGFLHFNELTLASGGSYIWNIRDGGTGDAWDASHDFVLVGAPLTLYVTATAEAPFVITPVTLSSAGVDGILGGFVAGQTYTWVLMDYMGISGITQEINPANVQLNLGNAFQSSLPGTASLEFTSLTGSGQLMLHFTAVPEPSTYALLALGLGCVGFTLWRRRRAG